MSPDVDMYGSWKAKKNRNEDKKIIESSFCDEVSRDSRDLSHRSSSQLCNWSFTPNICPQMDKWWRADSIDFCLEVLQIH